MIRRAVSEDSELIQNTISYRKPVKRLKMSNRVGLYLRAFRTVRVFESVGSAFFATY